MLEYCALLGHWSASALMLRAANLFPRKTKVAASSLLASAAEADSLNDTL